MTVSRVTGTIKNTTRETVPVIIGTKAMIGLKMTVNMTEKFGSSALTVPYSYFKGAQKKSDGCQE